MIIEYELEGKPPIRLEWEWDGSVKILETGDPTIDALPQEYRELTSEYTELFQRRYGLLFEILQLFDPPASTAQAHYAMVLERLQSTIRNRKLTFATNAPAELCELEFFLTSKLYVVSPRSTILIGWDILEYYPSVFSTLLSQRFMEYYFRKTHSPSTQIERIRDFLCQLKRRRSVVALGHIMIQDIIKSVLKHNDELFLVLPEGQELIEYISREYTEKLEEQLQNPLLQNAIAWHYAFLNRKSVFEPILAKTRNRPEFPQSIKTLVERAIQKCREVESISEPRNP